MDIRNLPALEIFNRVSSTPFLVHGSAFSLTSCQAPVKENHLTVINIINNIFVGSFEMTFGLTKGEKMPNPNGSWESKLYVNCEHYHVIC